MSDTMINRIAKAMQSSPAWPAVFDAGTAETLARVALETVREPTHSMEMAALRASRGCTELPGGMRPLPHGYDGWSAAFVFRAMIDAALSETT